MPHRVGPGHVTSAETGLHGVPTGHVEEQGGRMDRDSFVHRHLPEWQRLEALSAGASTLTGAEVDELVRLYQAASSHLSIARTRYRDPDLVAHLTRVVATANAVLHRQRTLTTARVREFLTVRLPMAMWRVRWSILVVASTTVAGIVFALLWIGSTPGAIEYAMPAEYRQYFVEEAFESYYSEYPAWLFAIRLFVNNAFIALRMFGAGVAAGLPSIGIAALNGWYVGVAGAIMADAGRAWTFWRLILPHGLLELTAIFLAGGAGVHLGWTLVAPGDRTRPEALGEEGRRAGIVALAAAAMLFLSALIEAWVTPSTLPDALRIGIGVAAWVLCIAVPLLAGRRLTRTGTTLVHER